MNDMQRWLTLLDDSQTHYMRYVSEDGKAAVVDILSKVLLIPSPVIRAICYSVPLANVNPRIDAADPLGTGRVQLGKAKLYFNVDNYAFQYYKMPDGYTWPEQEPMQPESRESDLDKWKALFTSQSMETSEWDGHFNLGRALGWKRLHALAVIDKRIDASTHLLVVLFTKEDGKLVLVCPGGCEEG